MSYYTFEADEVSPYPALPVRGLVLNQDGSENARAYFVTFDAATAWLDRMALMLADDDEEEDERCRACGHATSEPNPHCSAHE